MRPTPLRVLADSIPDVLKQQRRWCLWKHRNEGHRWTKIPCTTSGAYARSNDPSTWTTFDHAIAAYASAGFDGVGFFLGSGWAGLDLDDVTSGPVVDRLPCYRERSPSGRGIKAIGRSHRIGGEIKFSVTPPAFTTWSGARFFAVTGHGSGDPTIDITDLLDEWFAVRTLTTRAALPSYIHVGDTRGTERIERLTDEEIVQRILATPQKDKFVRLVQGDLSDYGGDHSRADQALCTILAYWCQGDTHQVDRMFRESGLMRDKWNAASYRRATLAKAVQS